MINFPVRSPVAEGTDPLTNDAHPDLDLSVTALPQTDGTPYHVANGQPVQPQQALRQPFAIAPNPIINAATSKETFDNRKKAIMASGPHVRMQAASFDQHGMPESLFTSLKDIFEAIVAQQARMGVVLPSRLVEVLREKFAFFRPPIHHDAHEFLNLLLNDIVEQVDAYTKKLASTAVSPLQDTTSNHAFVNPSLAKSSWVHELFEGILTSETRCLTCENVSQRDEIFLDLSVDLEGHSSVTSCLSRFSEEEMLSEKNKFQCEKCSSLQEAEKRMKIRRLPRILSLHLKRFKWVDGALRKLFDRIVFPFFLRIQNTTADAEDPDRLYELYAVIVHLGSTPHAGHYVSIIKTADRGWLLFDDELVLPVDANYVRRYFGGDPRNSACAYVLFYQESTEDAIIREQDMEDPYGQETIYGIPPREDGVSPPGLTIDDPPTSLDQLQTTVMTPTTDVPIPLTTPTTEEENFLAHISNPTVSSPGPPSSHVARLSSEDPTALGSNDSSARQVERTSTDKLRASAVPVIPDGRPPDKPPDKAATKHRMFSSGSISRFRNSSLSLKTKPKLFSKHERAESSKEVSESAIIDAGAGDTPTTEKDSLDANESHKPIKHRASRFALGRKKSQGNFL